MSNPEDNQPDKGQQNKELISLLKDLEEDKSDKPKKTKPKRPKKLNALPRVSSIETIKAEDSIGEAAIRATITKYGKVSDKILNNYDADRCEVQEVIDFLKEQVFANSPGKISNAYVEQLVGALKVKSDTNANFIKILDSFSKLVSVGKGELFAKKVSFESDDITRLLQAEVDIVDDVDEVKDIKESQLDEDQEEE